jgi:hypothetical protein
MDPVAADIVGKVMHVSDYSEANAMAFRRELDVAQTKGLTSGSVPSIAYIQGGVLRLASF